MRWRLLWFRKIETRLRHSDHEIGIVLHPSALDGLTSPKLTGGVGAHRCELVWIEFNGHIFACLRASQYHDQRRLV